VQRAPSGYAVVFPLCRYSGPLPADADQAIVLTADDLGDFGASASTEGFSRADYYVACSRAKNLLTVISGEPV
jgi:hypothetical protein